MMNALSSEPIRVLVVERTADAATVLGQALAHRFGARMAITTATSGDEALSIATRDGSQIIIANVHLGQGDGLSLCTAIRATPLLASVPILLLGDQTSAREKIAGFMSGADDYVVRPIDDRLLAARIELLWRLKGLGQLH